MKTAKPQVLAVCAALALYVLAGASGAADLTVEVAHVEDPAGTVYVGLSNAAGDFPGKPWQGLSMRASERSADHVVRVVFHDLAAGQYAVSAFLDLDANGKLSTNLMGVPTEPYGFSRDAHGNFGPPAFLDAAFALPPEGLVVPVTLH
jgi:uncharacterized protein (DUF2141 family)